MSYALWRFKRYIEKIYDSYITPTRKDINNVWDYLHQHGDDLDSAVEEVISHSVSVKEGKMIDEKKEKCLERYKKYYDECKMMRMNDYMNHLLLRCFLFQEGIDVNDGQARSIPTDIEKQYVDEIIDTVCLLSEKYPDEKWEIPNSWL